MPRIYIADFHAHRDWQQMVPDRRTVDWNGRAFKPEPEAGSVLICHALSEAQEQYAAGLAESGVIVVAISGNQPAGDPPNRIYYRKTPVMSPIDPLFARCLDTFLGHLDSQPDSSRVPMLDLLEGEAGFDSLKAYCCAVLAGGTVDADVRSRAREELAAWQLRRPDLGVAARLRGAVSHDLLQRTVLAFEDELLVRAVMGQDHKIAEGRQHLRELIELLPDGFNPSMVVEGIPDLCLPQKAAELRIRLNALFSADNEWHYVVNNVRAAATTFEASISSLAKGETSAQATKAAGAALQTALGRLTPVWLP